MGAALAAAGVAILRTRRWPGGSAGAIRIVTSRHLGAKRFLTIVEVDGDRFLLALAGERVSLLTRLSPAAGEAQREERASGNPKDAHARPTVRRPRYDRAGPRTLSTEAEASSSRGPQRAAAEQGA